MLIQPGRMSPQPRVKFPRPAYINKSPVQGVEVIPNFNAAQGTVFLDLTDSDVTNLSGSPVYMGISEGGSTTNCMFYHRRNTQDRFRMVCNSAGETSEVFDSYMACFASGRIRLAIGWDADGVSFWVNGALYASIDENFVMPVNLNQVELAQFNGSFGMATETLHEFRYYNKKLTQAQGRTLTFTPDILTGITFDPSKKFYALLGQSNSVGIATGSPVYPNISDMYLFAHDGAVKQYADPYTDDTNIVLPVLQNSIKEVGYAGFFANHMVDLLGQDIGVVPCNVNGSGLIGGPTVTWPTQSERAGYRTSGTKIKGLGTSVMATINRLSMLRQHGHLAGIIWGQGESDAGNAVSRNDYAAELKALIYEIRAALQYPGLPWFNVGMPDWSTDISLDMADYDAIIDGQKDVADSASRVYFVDGADQPGIPDDEQHYSLSSNETVGEVIAEEVWKKTTKLAYLHASYAGQSLMQQQTTINGGDGDAAYIARAKTYFDIVTTSQGATGGSGLLRSSNTGNYWVNNDADLIVNGPAYNNWVARIDADFDSPEDVHIIHWNQGQTDGGIVDLNFGQYKQALLMLFAAMKEKCPNAFIAVDYLGVDTNELAAQTWQRVREIQIEVTQEVSYIVPGVWTIDQPLDDTVHFNAAGRVLYGQRQADLAAFYLGKRDAQGVFGPVMTALSALQNTRNIKVALDLDGGDTLAQDADNLRYKGWYVEVNGQQSDVYAAQKSTETEFNLAVADFIKDGDIVEATWGYGPLNYPVPNQFPSNNAAEPKPLQPFARRRVVVSDAPAPPQTFGDVDAIWNADTVVLDGSARVEQLTDQSGNGFHIGQSDPSLRPEYHAQGGINGQPIIQSNSVSDGTLRYLLSNYGAKAGMTVTFVAHIANGNEDQMWGFNGNRAMVVGRNLNPTRIDYKRRDADNKNITITNGLYTDTAKPVIITLAVTGSTEMRLYENGSLAIAEMPFDPEDEITSFAQKLYLGTSVSDSVYYFGDAHGRLLTQDEIMRKHAYYKALIGAL